jgi:putative ABC transport system ATP-binding protein
MTTLISAENIVKDYVTGDVTTHVLHDIDLIIEEGDFVSIMGPSGSGKSTLMHILSFLDSGTSGTYLFRGEDVGGMNDDMLAQLRNKRIGFVFQSFHLLPRTTVYDNVALPLLYSDVPAQKHKKKIMNAIEQVGMDHRAHHYSNQLSGGEKQRVAIARAIVNNPDVLFADEPTGNLDTKSGTQILNILQSLNDEGKTIIMVTHENDVAAHAKRIIKIRDGVIEKDVKVHSRRSAKDREIEK